MSKKFGTPIVTVNNHMRGTSMGRKNRSLEAKHKKAKKMAVEYAIHSALDQSGFEYRMGDWRPQKDGGGTYEDHQEFMEWHLRSTGKTVAKDRNPRYVEPHVTTVEEVMAEDLSSYDLATRMRMRRKMLACI